MTSQNPVRIRMIEEMRVRNLSTETQRSYVHYVEDFARHYNTSPMNLGLDEIRNYRLHLLDVKLLSPQSVNCFVAAVKFLYTQVLDMPWKAEDLPYAKTPIKLPVVLTTEEIDTFFSAVGILKHRAVLMLCYGSGLRIAEAVSLQVSDIDGKRRLVRVQAGKGGNDRYSLLSERMLTVFTRILEDPASANMVVSVIPPGRAHPSRHDTTDLPGRLPDRRHHQARHTPCIAA